MVGILKATMIGKIAYWAGLGVICILIFYGMFKIGMDDTMACQDYQSWNPQKVPEECQHIFNSVNK